MIAYWKSYKEIGEAFDYKILLFEKCNNVWDQTGNGFNTQKTSLHHIQWALEFKKVAKALITNQIPDTSLRLQVPKWYLDIKNMVPISRSVGVRFVKAGPKIAVGKLVDREFDAYKRNHSKFEMKTMDRTKSVNSKKCLIDLSRQI